MSQEARPAPAPEIPRNSNANNGDSGDGNLKSFFSLLLAINYFKNDSKRAIRTLLTSS